ncbi:MAG: helicase-related protein, partial [Candidatus Auribacterota bacterium]|nr:helicase-related protein [Candidatus Auribacterota bacterium]
LNALSDKATPYFNRWVDESIDEDGNIKESTNETTETDTGRSGTQDLGQETGQEVPGGRRGVLAGTGRDNKTTESGDTVEAQQTSDVSETETVGDSQGGSVRSRVPDAGDDGRISGSRDAQKRRSDGSSESALDERPRGTRRNRVNYHIEDPELLIGGTPKKRFAKNKQAIETYNLLMEEMRDPTEAEKDLLAGYIGWGSFGQDLFQGTWEHSTVKPGWAKENEWLRQHLGEDAWKSAQSSIINAHYTDPPTVTAIWDILKQLGFKGGRVLEPSVGIGNFFGLMPKSLKSQSSLTGIELDETTAGIARMLYPKANIQQMGYQNSKTGDGFYDVVVGNWPFAAQSPADRRYNKFSMSLHDYFFVKALDQVRPGGFVVGITSSGSMDKKGKIARLQMAKRANLIAAFRMPSGAFKEYAGTSVVADLIIFQKREDGQQEQHHGEWSESVPMLDKNGRAMKASDGRDIFVNQYWQEHPDNVLGEMTVGHGTTQGIDGMIVNRPGNYADLLSSISTSVPKNILTPRVKTDHVRYVSNNTEERQNSITRSKEDGGLYIVKGERLANLSDICKYELKKNEKKTADRKAQIEKLIDIRNVYGQLLDSEREGKGNVEKIRKELKSLYDSFVKDHGSINQSYGITVFNKVDDPLHPALVALEHNTGTKKKPIYKPAKIFTQSTQRAKPQMENPSIAEAFVLERNENALQVNLKGIAEKAKTTVEAVKKELTEKNTIFETPDGNFEVADIYLSGNVKQKLREAQDVQKSGIDMTRNIEALEKVIPPDTPYFQIEASMGATWVPSEVYQDFIGEIGNLPEDLKQTIRLTPSTNGWIVRFDDKPTLNNRQDIQTMFARNAGGAKFTKLISSAFSGSLIRMTMRDENNNIVLDPVATQRANEKVDEIRENFKDWIWKDVERRVAMERQYNEIINAFAVPDYDGSFLNFDGMTLELGENEFNLRKHQVNAIWRGIANRRGLYAHEVGSGKTFTMAGIAIESRRYGLAKKPLILAHNANSAEVASDINVMYPGAKVLYIDNLTPKTIQSKLYQIANDDWDAVVMPHSLLRRLTLSRETLNEIAAEEIAALEAEAIESASDEGFEIERILDDPDALRKIRGAHTAKELVKQRNKIISVINSQAQAASVANAVTFENLGVDMMIIDEVHAYKKTPLSTKMRVKGLQSQGSKGGIGLDFLTSYIKKINNGTGVHTFTGTPITNTLNEIFNQMRYVMSEKMDDVGIGDWDSWFNTFAAVVSDIEITPAGDYLPVSRLSEFNNIPELRRFAGQYMDIVFAEDMPEFKPRSTKSGKTMQDEGLTEAEKEELLNGRVDEKEVEGRPYKKVVNEVADMNPDQEEALKAIIERTMSFRNASAQERYDIIKSGDRRSPILVEGDATKASFDARMYDKELSDHPTNKINRAIKNILEHYVEHPKTAQVVFMDTGYSDTAKRSTGRNADGEKITTIIDTFNASKDIIEKLVANDIPREQIAVVTGKTSKKKRQEIADSVSKAKIRVVIGLTSTLGTGVNMQENLRAMHHLDAPWMPGELEQRNGRGWRQGNRWNTVMEYRYITNKIDGKRWQLLAKKQKLIIDFLKAKVGIRSVSGDVLDMNESSELDSITASFSEAAGDARILMRTKLQKDLDKLLRKERLHDQGIIDAKKTAGKLEKGIESREKSISSIESDSNHYLSEKEKPFSIILDGKEYTQKKDAEKALEKISLKFAHSLGKGDDQVIGSFRGFEIVGERLHFKEELHLLLQRETTIDVKPSLASMNANLRNLAKKAQQRRESLAETRSSIEKLKSVAQEKFGQADLLQKKKGMLEQLEIDLQAYPDPPPPWLAQGAPIDTEIYVDKQACIVDGHRQGEHDYYLMVTKPDGTTDAISYKDAMDKNNMPIYEDMAEVEKVSEEPQY